MQVRDVMTSDVRTVNPDTSLKEVARLLVQLNVSGLPVCDATGAVVGVVSEADIVDVERPQAGRQGHSLRPRVHRPASSPATAGEAMTEPAHVTDPSTPLEIAAELMARHRIKRLPVVERGRLVGIVSRADVVRAFARSDSEVRREIAEDVLADQLWIHPPAVTCAVDAGVVRLTGRVDRRSKVAIVEDYVRRVPGVLEVDVSGLTWAAQD